MELTCFFTRKDIQNFAERKGRSSALAIHSKLNENSKNKNCRLKKTPRNVYIQNAERFNQ